MIRISQLYDRRDALRRDMDAASARHDYLKLARLTADYSAVSMDIDRVRHALASECARMLEELGGSK